MFERTPIPSGVLVVVEGDVDLATCDGLRDAIDRAAKSDDGSLVAVSLEGCTYIDSTCLSVLYRARRELGDRFCIVLSSRSRVHLLFRVAGVLDYFAIVPNIGALPGNGEVA
ncbi:MAG: hypothetical protein PVSMB8_12120 [Vulcanimicrobiaceae bacterium]